MADCRGRGNSVDVKSYKKYFGFLKGLIAHIVLKEEFETPLEYPETTGYIESVCVLRAYQRQGVATKLLEAVTSRGEYEEYMLDVTNINEHAIKCYEQFGFVECGREYVKRPKQKGFESKIIMKYVRRTEDCIQ